MGHFNPPAIVSPQPERITKNVPGRAVDVNRPVTLWCVPDAVLATRARTVTGGLTSPARLVTWGPVRKTTSGVLYTVSPSHAEPPENPGLLSASETLEAGSGITRSKVPDWSLTAIVAATIELLRCHSVGRVSHRRVLNKCGLFLGMMALPSGQIRNDCRYACRYRWARLFVTQAVTPVARTDQCTMAPPRLVARPDLSLFEPAGERRNYGHHKEKAVRLLGRTACLKKSRDDRI